MKMKKFISLALVAAMTAACLAGCGTKKDDSGSKSDSGSSDKKSGKVYYLSFKPEVDATWQEMANKFTEETGYECKVVTAASGKYEETLTAEVDKTEAPTLFQINGPIGYEKWKDYCDDLTGTDFAGYMTDYAKSISITADDKVYGVPYAVEGYGIIYNNAIMEKYFASAKKSADVKVKSAEEIKDFDTLKAVVEDMTKIKDELGIKGVFGATSLASGDQWRWQTHLMNMPLYYENKDNDSTRCPDELKFTYSKNYQNIFDLYINNSSTAKKDLSKATTDGSMAELALGECVMAQNGNWAWNTIKGTKGNVVKESDIKFMPIYTGTKDDQKQGICIGTENYMCINKNASEDDKKATQEFLKWVFNSATGKDYVVNKLGFITPFNTFSENEQTKDPLALEVLRYTNMSDVTNPTWVFATMPSEDFKNFLGSYLLKYTIGEMKWDDVTKNTITSWAAEVKKVKASN